MTAIDRWVCTQAFAQLERGAPRQGYISVNLMPNSISEPQFARWLLAELRSRPRLAGRLRFEIIETEQLHLGAAEQALFEQLHELGFGLFLDDFGSGYNSFEIVKRLPLDGIKLDGTVVRDYLTDPVDQALVQAAVSIARRMGLTLVAEGVENQAICQALADLGVHSFQGYLFHIPEPVESVCAHESAQPAAPAYSPAAATTEALAAGARRAPRG
jgi:EAL domain-containing protein (putative c-di-GMP-specific phosphodiesterase class I)